MKRIFLLLGVILFVSFVSSYPIFLKPMENGELQRNVNFLYNVSISSDALCSSLLISNSSVIRTREDGIGFLDLNVSSLTQVPTNICVWRNGAIELNTSFSDQIFRDIWARSLNISNNITASNFLGNINASYIQNAPWLTTFSETDPLWTGNQSSYSTTATILGWGYYNSTDFDINDYYLQSNPFGFYNSTDFDINDYLLNTGDTATGNYTFDTTTLHIDSSNDRVGIRTTSPSNPLSVVASSEGSTSADFTGGIDVAGGTNNFRSSTSAPTANFIPATMDTFRAYLQFKDASDSETNHLRFRSTNLGGASAGFGFQLSSDGSSWDDSVFMKYPTGEVGIGTTSPQSLLDVRGSGNFTGNISIGNLSSDALAYTFEVRTDELNGATKAFYIAPQAGSNPARRLFFGDATTTTTLNFKHVSQIENMPSFVITGTNPTVYFTGSASAIQKISTGGNKPINIINTQGDINWYRSGNTVTPANLSMVWQQSTGNVGIGTTSPVGTLHVSNGDSGQSSPNALANELVVEDDAAAGISILSANDNKGTIVFGDDGGNYRGGITYNHADDSFNFRTNGGDDRMVIDSSGKVGIGTASPQNPLNVIGDGNFTGGVSRYGFYYAYQSTAPTGLSAGSYQLLDLDQVDVADSDFYSESAGNVTIQKSGLYKISLSCDSVLTSGTREFAQCGLQNNLTLINDSVVSMYQRETSGVSGTSGSRTIIKQLNNGDVLGLYFKPDTTGVDPKDYGQSLTMEFIR